MLAVTAVGQVWADKLDTNEHKKRVITQHNKFLSAWGQIVFISLVLSENGSNSFHEQIYDKMKNDYSE